MTSSEVCVCTHVFGGVCVFDPGLGTCICKGLTSVLCGFSTVLVVSAPNPCLVQGATALQSSILQGPGTPREVQSKSEGTDLDFTKVTERPNSSPRGH